MDNNEIYNKKAIKVFDQNFKFIFETRFEEIPVKNDIICSEGAVYSVLGRIYEKLNHNTIIKGLFVNPVGYKINTGTIFNKKYE